ncbi:MAG: carbohydrate-binding domain-containing protein [Tannerella sp.]|jgi:hypothetical protein|nr:carbohydrate-binding domain-containing protein [Tannerella sp.]
MKMRDLIKGGVSLFTAIVVGVVPYSCKSEEAPENAPQIFNIAGAVTKSDGGIASGASVMLVRAADDGEEGQSSTNAAGEYIITGIGSGTYKIVVTFNGYETATIDGVKVINTDVTVDEIVLQKITVPTYRIGGSVFFPEGDVAEGVTVQVKKAGDNANIGQAASTDASGAYSIDGIPSGTYNIIFTLEGYETGILADITVNNTDLTEQNLTLQVVTINANAVNIVYSDNDATVSNLPSDGSVTATKSGADVTVSSSAAGTVSFEVSGSTSNGSLKIQNNADLPNTLRLILNSTAIASASKLPPVQVTKNEGVTIVELKGNNILSDNAANEENAALISKSGSLEFEGYGKLGISSAAKHAIASSKKNITVRGGDITVTAAVSDGFHAEAGFEISGGSLNITASGDGIDAGSGTATIDGGNIRITSVADDVKGIKADAGITVNGGAIDMSISGAQSKGLGSKSDIAINGGDIAIVASGITTLQAVGSGYDPSYCTAIKSDAKITVTGGNIRVESQKTSDGGRGISADGDIEIRGGTLNITTAGDGKSYTAESGVTDSYTAACLKSNRNISLLAGNITCSSSGTGGKGVNADGTITVGVAGANNSALVLNAFTSGERFFVSGSSGGGSRPGGPGGGFGDNGSDYANPKAVKCDGNMTVNSGTIVINCTQKTDGGEGLESKGTLTVNGGNINIHTYDDCINAAGIVINNGNIFCAASGNDAIDSNASLTVNGGLTIANGVRGDGEAFDSERNVQVNGGIIVGTSGNTMSGFSGTQRSCGLQAATGSSIGIRNQAGEYLLLFTVPVIAGATAGSTVVVVFSDPRLVSGSYTLLTGGSISGGVTVNGYNTGGTYSGGSSKGFNL